MNFLSTFFAALIGFGLGDFVWDLFKTKAHKKVCKQELIKVHKNTLIGRSTKYRTFKVHDHYENKPWVTRRCTLKRNHNY